MWTLMAIDTLLGLDPKLSCKFVLLSHFIVVAVITSELLMFPLKFEISVFVIEEFWIKNCDFCILSEMFSVTIEAGRRFKSPMKPLIELYVSGNDLMAVQAKLVLLVPGKFYMAGVAICFKLTVGTLEFPGCNHHFPQAARILCKCVDA